MTGNYLQHVESVALTIRPVLSLAENDISKLQTEALAALRALGLLSRGQLTSIPRVQGSGGQSDSRHMAAVVQQSLEMLL